MDSVALSRVELQGIIIGALLMGFAFGGIWQMLLSSLEREE